MSDPAVVGPVLLIAEFEISDPDSYRIYREAAKPTVGSYGGRVLGRAYDAEVVILEGSWVPDHVVIIEFPALDDALAWHSNPSMTAAHLARQSSCKSRFTIVPSFYRSSPRIS